MPLYVFYNTETEEEFEDIISISEKAELLSKNPHIRAVPTTFGIASIVGSIDSKTDNTWKEVLSKVAEAHPDSNVGQRYGRSTDKAIKTKKIVEKHLGKWKNQ